MTIDRHLSALVAKFSRLAWCTIAAIFFVSCEGTAPLLGSANLKSEGEVKFAFVIPARPKSQVGWSLRFGMLPWAQFNSLRDSDKIMAFLTNDNNASVGFRKKLRDDKIVIQSGEKAEIFQGKLSDFISLGRGEEVAMSFDPAETNLNFTLHLVTQLKSATSCTIQISIFHYPDYIL